MLTKLNLENLDRNAPFTISLVEKQDAVQPV